ncbi:MAG TPA: FAD-dependent oxidoreductase [Opitutaceae bacterium]
MNLLVMKTLYLSDLSVPLDDQWDVIVIGGGPAGCTAAASAAREGARTLLLEATGCLGGMGTSALVPAWTPFSDKEKIIYRGMAEKVFSETKAGMAHVKKDALDWVPIDPERLKRVYDDLVTSAGASILFHTHLSKVETRDRRVEAILVTNKSGLTALKAKVYVDCTGDADVCAWAGADFHKGDEHGNRLMPATHCFVLTNIDEYALLNGPDLHPRNPKSPIYEILRSGKYPEIPDAHLNCTLIGPRTAGFNAGHLWNVDNTDPASIARAMVQGRKIAEAFRAALAEYFPQAFAGAFLITTGSLMGIRETRRIVGDYILTLEDYLKRRSFEDEICRNSYFIDVHWAKEEAASRPGHYDQWDSRCFHYGLGESHGIPYRCLTPRALDNVLVAGRSISCEQIVQGSVRVMPVCLALGEAAGMAAAHAAEQPQADVHRVSASRLRSRLLEEGAYLPEVKLPAAHATGFPA